MGIMSRWTAKRRGNAASNCVAPRRGGENRAPRCTAVDLRLIVRQAEERGELVAAVFRVIIFLALVAVDLGEGLSLPTTHPFVAVTAAYGLVSGIGLCLAWWRVRFGALSYVLASVDVIVLAASLSMTEQMVGISHDHAMALPAFSLVFLMLIHASMRYNPALVVYAATLFLAALLLFDWLLSSSMHISAMVGQLEPPAVMPTAPWSSLDLLHYRSAPIIFVSLAAVLLFYITWRTRRLLEESIHQENRVARLSRFFPQTVVAQLSALDGPLRTPRTQAIAVLFADVVGFTRLIETATSEEIIAFLRDFHNVLEEAVFDSGGTLDKFLGDGIMATFGTPTTGHRDASNAFDCALAMFSAMDHWNARRRERGEPPIRLSVGIHHGVAVLGEIGSARRLELAVVGDVVNVASRLEALTRPLACRMAVSEAFVRAVRGENADHRSDTLAELRQVGLQALHGRAEPVTVWTWGTSDPEPSSVSAETVSCASAVANSRWGRDPHGNDEPDERNQALES